MRTYKGKNAWWVIGIFIIYNILPVIIYFNTNEIVSNIWWSLMWCIYYGFNIILIPILIKNNIELYDDYFIFYYGFSKQRIDIKDITKIEKSRNPIASSANSLDRIHIVTKNKELYVSLKENDMFIKDINHRKQKEV